MSKAATIDAYIAALPQAARPVAEALRATFRAAAPDAAESIRYGMPAFGFGNGRFLYFALWKAHAGIYPVYRGDAGFEALVAPWRDKTDTVRLPLSQPVPQDVVVRIVQRAAQDRAAGDGPAAAG